LRSSELEFFYQEGSSWIFPDFHEELVNTLPENERGQIIKNFNKHVTGDDEEMKLKCAKAWTKWEMATCKLLVNEEQVSNAEDERFAIQFARIETHYFVNLGFFRDNQLLEDCHKIKHIPMTIVNGRYDVVCPIKSAWELKQQLPKAELFIIPDAGHACSEAGTIDALIRATDRYALDK